MALISFPVLMEMDFLLGLWLKEVPEGAATFCKLAVLCNLLGCLGEGIPNLINACGHIKAYQVIVHTILILGLPIAFFLYKAGANMYTIVIVFCVINFVNSFVKLIMLRRVVQFDVLSFMKISHLRVLLMTIPLVLYYYFYEEYINPQNILGHIIGILSSVAFFAIVVLVLGLEKTEKAKVRSFIVKKIK